MADEPDPERLRALDARLSKVKGAKVNPSGTGKDFSQGEQAWRMVIELVAGLLLGLGIGYGLDHVFGTMPIFLLIFVLLGFVAGIKTMLPVRPKRNSEDRSADAGGSLRRNRRMTDVAAEAETGFAIHPMDQFIVPPRFCDDATVMCVHPNNPK
ncbi:MAG: AtpZ/AtpI family protein [Gemmobacter sp.]|nr:AtpZ/AtpI family protein [Gemmobacter sp.]